MYVISTAISEASKPYVVIIDLRSSPPNGMLIIRQTYQN